MDRYRTREQPREAWGSGRVNQQEEGEDSTRLPTINKGLAGALQMLEQREQRQNVLRNSTGSLPSAAAASPTHRHMNATMGGRGGRAASPEVIRAEGMARNLRYELAAAKNRAASDQHAASEEISGLKREVASLKEQTERQRAQIRELERALAEYQRVDQLQARTLASSTHQLDGEIRALKNRLREVQESRKAELATAMELSKHATMERNALATAMAYLAQQAVRADVRGQGDEYWLPEAVGGKHREHAVAGRAHTLVDGHGLA